MYDAAICVEEDEDGETAVLEAAFIKASHIMETPAAKKSSKRAFPSVSSKEDSQGKIQRTVSSGALSVAASGAEAEPDSDLCSAMGSKEPSAKMGKAAPKESPQDICSRWMQKLNLQDILEGRKLGVSLRHATTALTSLPTKERLTLSMHCQFAQHATTLSPEVVSTVSKAQINDSVTALQSSGLKWPIELQQFLWTGHVNDLMMNARFGRQDAQLDEYWSRVRPYSKEPLSLNLLEPSLAALANELLKLEMPL